MRNITYIPLKLGIVGTINNTVYTIVGRVRWASEYKEFYEEDGKKGYKSATWTYDEWILKDNDGKTIYLCEDKEGFVVSREIKPELKPRLQLNQNQFATFFKSHPNSRIYEYGTSRIWEREGEVGEDNLINKSKQFFQYQYKDIIYVNEVIKPGSKEEIKEYYEEKKISRKSVLNAFKNDPVMSNLLQQLGTLSWATAAFGLATLIFFGMFIFSFATKKTILSHSVYIPADISPDSALSIPTWQIDKSNQLYLLEMNYSFPSSLPSNLNEVFVSAYVYEEGQGIVSELVGDYYYESGYDSDGAWTESQTSAHQFVRSDKKSKYFAELYVEQQPRVGGTVNFYVKERWFPWYYTLTAFLTALSITLILALIYWQRSS